MICIHFYSLFMRIADNEVTSVRVVSQGTSHAGETGERDCYVPY
jgi:hypothetical protein